MRSFAAFFLWIACYSSTFAQLFSEQGAAVGIPDHAFRARALIGGGAAFFDYDNDGDEDLYFTGGYDKDRLYENNGDGTFTRVLAEIGFGITQFFYTAAVSTGDIDNDGHREVFVTTWEEFAGSAQPIARHLIFKNNGNGTFIEFGTFAGITDPAFGLGAVFTDYNRDGLLDIFVLNHIAAPIFTYDSTGSINGYAHQCYANFLYRNNGDLTFTEVAGDLGLDSDGCSIAGISSDMDMDGDLDLYIANDYGAYVTPNELYAFDTTANTFQDVSEVSGADIGLYGMGIAAGDYDQDLDIDYYVTNIGRNVLIENQGDGTFVDVTTTAGVENEMVNEIEFTTGWGTAFLDVDNDALLDLFVANGRIPALPSNPTSPNDPNKLYLNNGDKTFTDVSEAAGIDDIRYGRGFAYSDYDQDGDLDMVVVVLDELGGTTRFYVNDTENDHHYVQFKLTGTISNRDAYGSKLWLYAGGQTFVREIYGGGDTYASQNTSIVHFGLKDIDQVDSLRVEWPSGHIDHFGEMSADSLYHIEENMQVTGIEDDLKRPFTWNIQIAPNPFSEYIVLNSNTTLQEAVSLQLISATGQVVFAEDRLLQQSNQINFDKNLPQGVYALHIQLGNEQVVKKLIKL